MISFDRNHFHKSLVGKWSIITLIMVSMLTILKTNNSHRKVASVYELDCIGAMKPFLTGEKVNKSLYEVYKGKLINQGLDNVESFENVEHYLAWIDLKLDNKDISLNRYLLESSKFKKEIMKFVISRQMPGKKLSFLFDDIFELLIFKSAKINNLTKEKKFGLKMAIVDRIVKEAIEKLNSEPEGKFSRLINKVGAKKVFNFAGLLTTLVPPHIPLWLPKVDIMYSTRLLKKADSIDEMKEIYHSLDLTHRNALAVDKGYEIFRRYYLFGVAIFYNIYMIYEVDEINDQIEHVQTLDEAISETIVQFETIKKPNCDSLEYCLNDFRSEWQGQDASVYLEYKEACIQMYEIPKECN